MRKRYFAIEQLKNQGLRETIDLFSTNQIEERFPLAAQVLKHANV